MLLQYETQSELVCVRGDGWKLLGIHGVLERYRSQSKQDQGHNGDGATKERERSTKPQQ